MPQQAFFIGPYDEGLVTAVKPWALPEKAFTEMRNAYVWRGRVKKRVGSKFFESATFTDPLTQLGSRLRMQIGTTDAGTGNFNHGGLAIPGAIWKIGQMFSIGTTLFTVYQANGAMLTTGTATGTFNTATGMIAITGNTENPLTAVYWYPAEPVMGIVNYEDTAINNEPSFAFDTQFAYYRTGNGWDRLGLGIWTGSNAQFFWACNWRGVTNDNYYLFVVNNNRADQIKFWTGAAWTTINPQTRLNPSPGGGLAANYRCNSARIILPYKDRLILLNTLETVDPTGAGATNVHFAQRARWSRNGDPTTAVGAWYDDQPGVGDFADAPTKQAIITARILKDRLVVYFERSTWELVYTGNAVKPFIWQVLDDQLGAESTHSSVLFDKVVYGIGQNGIHACDGLHVERIDPAIPQLVFAIHNDNNGVDRVAGIRDYATEMVYWAYPDEQDNTIYPDRVLSFNYNNGSWGVWDDCITAFGYYQNVADLTWEAASTTWGSTSRYWVSASMQSLFRNVLAGNQEGYTFIMDNELGRNAPGLQITNMDITGFPIIIVDVIDHNLRQGEFVLMEDAQGVTNLEARVLKVAYIASANQVYLHPYDTTGVPAGTYAGGGTLTRISRMDIRSKEFNFYQDHRRIAINKVDFDVDQTEYGRAKVGFYSSTGANEIGIDAVNDGVALGSYTLDTYNYVLYPFEATQARLVRPVYIQAEGDCVQVQIYMDEELMFDWNVQNEMFELNSMTFHVTSSGPRL